MFALTSLFSLLPAPVHQHPGRDYEQNQYNTEVSAPVARIPPYGKRAGFKPKKPEDFGDGGAFPEIHIAQYPLDMGRKKKVSCFASVDHSEEKSKQDSFLTFLSFH